MLVQKKSKVQSALIIFSFSEKCVSKDSDPLKYSKQPQRTRACCAPMLCTVDGQKIIPRYAYGQSQP